MSSFLTRTSGRTYQIWTTRVSSDLLLSGTSIRTQISFIHYYFTTLLICTNTEKLLYGEIHHHKSQHHSNCMEIVQIQIFGSWILQLAGDIPYIMIFLTMAKETIGGITIYFSRHVALRHQCRLQHKFVIFRVKIGLGQVPGLSGNPWTPWLRPVFSCFSLRAKEKRYLIWVFVLLGISDAAPSWACYA